MHIERIVLHVVIAFEPDLVCFYLLQPSCFPIEVVDPLALREVTGGEAEVGVGDDFKSRVFSVDFSIPIRVCVDEDVSWIPSVVRVIYYVDVLVVFKESFAYQNMIKRCKKKNCSKIDLVNCNLEDSGR